MDKDKEYFAKWYGREGAKVSARRKERYRSDPEYRAKVLAANRKRRRMKRAEPPDKRVIVINGQRVERYTIGNVAHLVGKTPQAVRMWEKRGIIPEAQVHNGTRLYTENQMNLIAQVGAALTECRSSRNPLVQEEIRHCFERWRG